MKHHHPRATTETATTTLTTQTGHRDKSAHTPQLQPHVHAEQPPPRPRTAHPNTPRASRPDHHHPTRRPTTTTPPHHSPRPTRTRTRHAQLQRRPTPRNPRPHTPNMTPAPPRTTTAGAPGRRNKPTYNSRAVSTAISDRGPGNCRSGETMMSCSRTGTSKISCTDSRI